MSSLNNKNIITEENGFSMVEVIAALAIVTLAFIYIMRAFPFSLSINKLAERSSTASFLAQEKIEELNSLGYVNINTGTIEPKTRLSADTANYLYNFYRKTDVYYVNENLNIESADQGLKKITITIYYIQPLSKTEKQYILTTLLSE